MACHPYNYNLDLQMQQQRPEIGTLNILSDHLAKAYEEVSVLIKTQHEELEHIVRDLVEQNEMSPAFHDQMQAVHSRHLQELKYHFSGKQIPENWEALLETN